MVPRRGRFQKGVSLGHYTGVLSNLVATLTPIIITEACPVVSGDLWCFASTQLRGCLKVEGAVLGSPSLILLMVSVDVTQH